MFILLNNQQNFNHSLPFLSIIISHAWQQKQSLSPTSIECSQTPKPPNIDIVQIHSLPSLLTLCCYQCSSVQMYPFSIIFYLDYFSNSAQPNAPNPAIKELGKGSSCEYSLVNYTLPPLQAIFLLSNFMLNMNQI